jgi:hypothetical protein
MLTMEKARDGRTRTGMEMEMGLGEWGRGNKVP